MSRPGDELILPSLHNSKAARIFHHRARAPCAERPLPAIASGTSLSPLPFLYSLYLSSRYVLCFAREFFTLVPVQVRKRSGEVFWQRDSKRISARGTQGQKKEMRIYIRASKLCLQREEKVEGGRGGGGGWGTSVRICSPLVRIFCSCAGPTQGCASR